MAYKDPQRRREYHREYKRLRRGESLGRGSGSGRKSTGQTGSQTAGQPSPGVQPSGAMDVMTTPSVTPPTPATVPLPAQFRLRTAHDVLELIAEQVLAVREDQEAGTLEKARVVGYLASIALRAVETADMADRVEALERVLKLRKEQETPCTDVAWPRISGN